MVAYTYRRARRVLLAGATVLIACAQADAQPNCAVYEVTSGLQRPIGITRSNQGNLLVSEAGTPTPNTGRISIVDLAGNRRTLLDGLPSGISFEVNEPSGPAGIFMRGRTLYAAIGVGDAVQAGPVTGTTVPNPTPSSPIFRSVLAIHFSANIENTTAGGTLTLADQQALASGGEVVVVEGNDRITVTLVANFPDFTPSPLPFFAGNVRNTNPFDLVRVGDRLYVSDGGQNLVWEVDVPAQAFSVLAVFPPVPNPLPLGPPFVESVPTGIAYFEGRLLVSLFKGVPFPPGASLVIALEPLSGDATALITGRTAAIDVLPLREGTLTEYLVLQHASSGPFLTGPGLLLRFTTPGGVPSVLADCLNRPTSMTIDEQTRTVYVTELVTGRIVAIGL